MNDTKRTLDLIGRALRGPGADDPATLEALSAAMDAIEASADRRQELEAERMADRQFAELGRLWDHHVTSRAAGEIDAERFWKDRGALAGLHRAERRSMGL